MKLKDLIKDLKKKQVRKYIAVYYSDFEDDNDLVLWMPLKQYKGSSYDNNKVRAYGDNLKYYVIHIGEIEDDGMTSYCVKHY